MSLSIGGIASGLDTDAIIESLMKIEAIPQSLLQTKKATTESFVTALQALNAKVGSLTENAAKAADAKSYDVWKGTASNSSVTVATAEGATAATIEFQVDKLATGRSILSGPLEDASSLLEDGTFTFTNGKGETVTVTPESDSLSDLVSEINNASGLGLKATVITTTQGQRLQISSSHTGAEEGTFALTSGQGEAGFDQIRGAADAQITLWPGLGLAGSTVTSASNTFADLAPGISITVSQVAKDGDRPVTVDVVKDTAAISKLGENLVSQLNLVLAEIASRASVTTTTGTDGQSAAKGGIFTGDSMARQITSLLTEAGIHPVNGKSPSTIGITLEKDGTFKFDPDKFAKVFAESPVETQDFLNQLAGRVQGVGKSLSDQYEGSLSMRIQSQNGLVTEYGKQIENWDIRLTQRRQSLVQMYTAMEVTLSNLQAQSSRLGSQLTAMSGQNGN